MTEQIVKNATEVCMYVDVVFSSSTFDQQTVMNAVAIASSITMHLDNGSSDAINQPPLMAKRTHV